MAICGVRATSSTFAVVACLAALASGGQGVVAEAPRAAPSLQQPPTQPPPQQPPAQQPPQRQPPTFRAGVKVVRVDVSVTGSGDKPVTDLTAADFEVSEDGVPQKVDTAQFVRLDGQRKPGGETSLAIRSREHGIAEAARDDVRVFVVFLDDYHIDRLPSITLPLRRELTAFLMRLQPTDLVALADPLTTNYAIGSRRRRGQLLQSSASSRAAATRSPDQERGRRSATEERRRLETTGAGNAVGARVVVRLPRRTARGAQDDHLHQPGAAARIRKRERGNGPARGHQGSQPGERHHQRRGSEGAWRGDEDGRLALSPGCRDGRPDGRQHEQLREGPAAGHRRCERVLPDRLHADPGRGRWEVPQDLGESEALGHPGARARRLLGAKPGADRGGSRGGEQAAGAGVAEAMRP